MPSHFTSSRVSSALMLILVLAFVPGEDVSASAFTVTPVRVTFDRPGSSTLMTLNNESGQTLRFQISAFSWSQSPEGEMLLEPTGDVLFFPTLVALDAGESRKIRVGLNTPPGPVEKSYRIFFEELPPLETPGDPSAGSQVRILTKMGVPIFVSPEKKRFQANVENLTIEGGTFGFDIVNRGNVQFSAQLVQVTGIDDAGETLFEKQQGGWYVLADGSRHYTLELNQEECEGLSSMSVEIRTDFPPQSHDPVLRGSLESPGCNE